MLTKSLNELAPFIGQNVANARQIVGLLCKNKLEVLAIFDYFQEHVHATNEEAAKAVPGMELSSFKKYGRQLLKILKQLVPLTISDDSHVASIAALDTSILRTLEQQAAWHTIREIALDLYQRGKDADRPIWVFEALMFLIRTYFFATRGRLKEFDEYQIELEKYEKHATLENKTMVWMAKINAIKQFKKSSSKDLIEAFSIMENGTKEHIGKTPSLFVHTWYYITVYNKHFLQGNYLAAIQAIDEGFTYLESRQYPTPHAHTSFLNFKAYALRMLGRFDEGVVTITQSVQLCPKGSFNWLMAYQIGFYLQMSKGDYIAASKLFIEATTHKSFINKSPSDKETWYIIGAYLYIALRLSQTPLPEKGFKPYKSGKFLNEIEHYHHDKSGLYATALCAHTILLALEGQSDRVYDRVEALEKYRERYLLPNNAAPRTAQFVKIIIALVKADFKPKLYEDKLPTLLKDFEEAEHGDEYQPFEWEIIPTRTLLALLEQMERVQERAAN
jgi:tetratricopeptide (TPR) repeat protein